jgi:predicted MFS family arabinose efflux permease
VTIAEPAPASPSSSSSRLVLLAFGAAVFIVNLDARVLAPLLPAIARELGLSIGQAGILVTSYLLPYGLFQLAYGPLADRFGKIRVAAHTMLVFSVGTALCGAHVSLATMVFFRALTGAAAAALFPLALAFIGDTVPYTRRQAAIGGLMAAAGAAQAFSTGIGGIIAELLSWRTVFPLVGLLGGVLTVALFGLAGREPRHSDQRRPARYRDVLVVPGLPRLLALVLVEGLLFTGGFSFIGALLEARFRLGALAAGLLMSLAGVTQLAAARALPVLLARLGSRALLIAGGCLMSVGFLAVALAPAPAVVGLGCALMGVGFTACHTNLQARATEAFPAARATAVALFAFSLFLGSGTGAALYAFAIDHWGYGPSFLAAALALFAFTAAAARGAG